MVYHDAGTMTVIWAVPRQYHMGGTVAVPYEQYRASTIWAVPWQYDESGLRKPVPAEVGTMAVP